MKRIMTLIKAFITKYMMLVVPCSILIVAILLFVPLLMAKGSLAKDMDESVKDGKTVVSLDKRTPPSGQFKVEREYQNAFDADAVTIEDLAKQTTERTLITYDVFPKPVDSSNQIFPAFGEVYREEVRNLMKALGANDAPSDQEIKTATQRLGGGTARGSYYGGRSSGRGNQDAARDAVVDMLCQTRADGISVYAATSVFKWYDYWNGFEFTSKKDAIDDCWYSQLSFWIYEDIVKAIQAMNSGSTTVTDPKSRVKRLIGISFDSPADYSDRRRDSGVSGDQPEYVTDLTAGLLAVVPWTARICDDHIDVIHFSVSVIMDVRSVPLFFKELTTEKTHQFKGYPKGDGEDQTFKHNQITILKYSQQSLDLAEKRHEYYRYGNGALVRLDMICEYILDRGGYDEIKPEQIKQFLGQVEGAEEDDE